jgi:hypothetical protein
MRDRKNSAVHPLTFFLVVYLVSILWLLLFDGEQYHELFSVLSESPRYATTTVISVLGMMLSVVVILKAIDEKLAVTTG